MFENKADLGVGNPGSNMPRRAFLLAALTLPLAACVQTVLTPEVAQDVTIRRVTVRTDQLGQMSVRGLPITPERLASDLQTALEGELGKRMSSSGNADLLISIDRVLLVSPGQSFVIGGRSFIDATVVVTRVSDGARIAGPKTFSGLPEGARPGGIIGAIAEPEAWEDYRTTVSGFATMLEKALFEGGAPIY